MSQEKGFGGQVQVLGIPQSSPRPHPVRDTWLHVAGSAYPDAPAARSGGQSYRWDQKERPSLTAYPSALLTPSPQAPRGRRPFQPSLSQLLPGIN